MVEITSNSGYPPNFFYYNELVQKISGLWVPEKKFNIILKFLYGAYALSMHTLGFCYVIWELQIVKSTMAHMSELISLIGIILTHFAGILKLMLMVFGRKKIKTIMEKLQEAKYQYGPSSDYRPAEFFLKEMKTNSVICMMIFSMYSFAAISAAISMFLRVLNEVQVDRFEGTNVTCSNFIPYLHRIPFVIDTKNKCLTYAFFQGIPLLNFSFIIATADGVFIGLNNCLQAQLKILGGAFTNIRAITLKSLNLPKNYDILNDADNLQFENGLFSHLSHCIEHLQLLISVRDDIEYMFSFITLFQTLASLLTFASCLFIASTVPVSSPIFFAKMQYFTCVLIQLFLICWSGNRITLAAGSIIHYIYESDWFSGSRRFKRCILLTMIRMNKAMYLSIGKFTPLTLTTIVVVCRLSFSYFTVFKSVQ